MKASHKTGYNKCMDLSWGFRKPNQSPPIRPNRQDRRHLTVLSPKKWKRKLNMLHFFSKTTATPSPPHKFYLKDIGKFSWRSFAQTQLNPKWPVIIQCVLKFLWRCVDGSQCIRKQCPWVSIIRDINNEKCVQSQFKNIGSRQLHSNIIPQVILAKIWKQKARWPCKIGVSPSLSAVKMLRLMGFIEN